MATQASDATDETGGESTSHRCANCGSSSFEARTKTAINGAFMVALQCLHCGSKHGNWLAHETLAKPANRLPPWDNELSDAFWRIKRQQTLAPIHAEREARSQEWWAAYNAHLASQQWRNIRARVMARARYSCEGCAQAKATQVHHLTYTHVGHELLWELVAVCDDCHQTAHGAGK